MFQKQTFWWPGRCSLRNIERGKGRHGETFDLHTRRKFYEIKRRRRGEKRLLLLLPTSLFKLQSNFSRKFLKANVA